MKDIYLIGNAHLDPVWLWRKPEGMAEILSTFRSALDRMKEFPDYIFTAACASYYQWVEKTDPEMFEEIKQRVKEGRWVIVGGFWIQPDCNLPSGEAFARHALYSQQYYQEKFDRIAKVGYNVDSFGHNGMYPQILRQSGMDSYVFMRPDMWENSTLPGFAFQWESPDGSRVKVGRISHGYSNLYWGKERYPEYENMTEAEAKIHHLRRYVKKDGYGYMSFYGVGNHGGGPTVRDLEVLTRVVKEDDTVVFASPDDYFRDLEGRDMPVWRSDLQHHASGCYAANSQIKAINRRAENMLVGAEQFAVMANRLTGAESQQAEIKRGWERVMFNQFHDILTGCSIYEAAQDAIDAFGSACDTAAEVSMLALQRIARKIRTTDILDHSPAGKNGWILWEKEGEGAPVIIFNPHGYDVETQVQINTTVIAVTDHEGTPVQWQYVRGPQTNGHDHLNTLFTAKIPAWGWAVYHIFGTHDMTPVDRPKAVATATTLENELLKATFDPATGLLVSVVDKETGRELASAPMGRAILIENEECDTWSHARFTFDNKIDEFTLRSMDVLEEGPVRAAIRVVTECRKSTMTQIYYLNQGSRQLDVTCETDYHEPLKIVKLCFPAAAEKPQGVYSMPSGFLVKGCEGTEEPAHEWTAVCDADTGLGLALMNDGRYSYSLAGNEMRMTAVRSAAFADHYGVRDDRMVYMDQGRQVFHYAIAPFAMDKAEDTARAARLLNRPVSFVMEGHHDGVLPNVYTGLKVSNPQVIVQATKESEDGQAWIVRLLEVGGRAAQAMVELPLLDKTLELSFRPQEIKTVRIPKDGGEAKETNFLE